MKRKHAFIPVAADELEPRVVLSQGAAARGVSVLVGGLTPRRRGPNIHRQPVVKQPIIAEVNQAFDQFQSDYNQTRATYLASILGQPAGSVAALDAMNAFKLFTTQRVSLLSQQVVGTLLQTPQGTARAHGQPNTLVQLTTTQLINPRSLNANGLPNGMLVQSLVKSIPTAGASPSTQALYNLSQDNAIEAARASVLNGVSILRNGDFGNKSSEHKHH